jgi:hypothetical protein
LLVPAAPGATLTDVGEADIVNEGGAVTVRVTVAVCEVLPLVPLRVIV